MTSFEKVYSLAKVVINDYKIDQLVTINYNAFLEVMRSFITLGIPEFNLGCLQSLEWIAQKEVYNNETVTRYYFLSDLDVNEVSILAKTIIYFWWTTKVNDVKAFMPKLSTKDFKNLAEGAGLKQRSEHQDKLYENIQYSITQYQLGNLRKLPFFGGN